MPEYMHPTMLSNREMSSFWLKSSNFIACSDIEAIFASELRTIQTKDQLMNIIKQQLAREWTMP